MVKRRFNLLKVIIAVCVLALSLSIASAFAVKNKTVSADAYGPTPVPTTSKLEMVAGVSIKMTGNGLRYRVMIDDTTWLSIKDDDSVSLGILIFPTKYISDDSTIVGHYHAALADQTSHATYGTFAAQDVTIEKGKVYISMINGNQYYCANGVLTNIKDAHRNLEYTAVGYTYDGATYKYASQNCAKSLQAALSCMYFCPNADDRADYRTALASYYSTNTWLGTEDYPYIIDTSGEFAGALDYYNAVIESVKAGETFSGKYFYITVAVSADSDTELIGHNGSYDFAGTFVKGSGIVKAPDGTAVVNDFNFAQSVQELMVGGYTYVNNHDYRYFGYGVTWHNEVDDENGVVEINWDATSNAWPWFTFLPNNPVSDYESGYSQLRIKMKLESAKKFNFWVMANSQSRRSCCLNENFVTLGSWAYYYFDIDAFTYYWDTVGANDYQARVWSNSATGAGALYISEIKALATGSAELWTAPTRTEGEIREIRGLDLDDVAMTNTTYETYTLSIADKPTDATHGSVLYKISNTTAYSTFKMTPRFDSLNMSEFGDYSYVQIRLKVIPTATNGATGAYLYAYPSCGASKQEERSVEVNKWVTVDLMINTLYLSGCYSKIASVNGTGWFSIGGLKYDESTGKWVSAGIDTVLIYSVMAIKEKADADGKYFNVNYGSNATNRTYLENFAWFTTVDGSDTALYQQSWAVAGADSCVEGNYNCYMVLIRKDANKTTIPIVIKPTCTYNEFFSHKYIRIRLASNSTALGTITVNYFNRALGTVVTAGVSDNTLNFTDVYFEIASYASTGDASAVFNNQQEFFYWRFWGQTFKLSFSGTATSNLWLYIQDVELVDEAPFTNFSREDITTKFASTSGTAATWSKNVGNMTAVVLTSNSQSGWTDITIKSGITESQLDSYIAAGFNQLKITVRHTCTSSLKFYTDGTTDGYNHNQFGYTAKAYSYPWSAPTGVPSTPPAAGSATAVAANTWTDLYMPLSWIKTYWKYSYDPSTGIRKLLQATQNVSSFYIYIHSVTIVKV